MEPRYSSNCFVCGKDNPIGMKVEFRLDEDEVVADYRVRPEHMGWEGVMHGGLIATLLDEAIAYIAWHKGLNTVTGRLEVRYFRPASVGEELTVRGRIVRQSGRGVQAEAEATSGGGVVARATALAVAVKS